VNIDQRLDRLTQHHEALTQTVEIIAAMQKKNEEAHQRNQEAHRRNEESHRKNEVLLAHVMESIDSLARMAHAHEQRITQLEDGRT